MNLVQLKSKVSYYGLLAAFCAGTVFLPACNDKKPTDTTTEVTTDSVATNTEKEEIPPYDSERFADLRILRYEVKGFDELPLSQKKLLYYLSEAGRSGRDITYDQNYKNNLLVRKTLENIYKTYNGDKSGEDWQNFETYLKRIWFSNGIHHHYSEKKMMPEFSYEYFEGLVNNSDVADFPTKEGEEMTAFLAELKPIMFDANVDGKKVNKTKGQDLVKTSAANFYENLSQKEVENFYKIFADKNDATPISYGLNSQLIRGEAPEGALVGLSKDGIYEYKYGIGTEGKRGKYAAALEKMVYWLEKASTVAESAQQKKVIDLLVKYYKTGDLKTFDEMSIAWVETTDTNVDFINGFIEVYGDPLGYRAHYESVIFMDDKEASKRMAVLSENAQYFEDNSSIMDEHKKKEVKGVTYRIITVVNEAGDAAPSTPIGINLPNANWIRKQHGSKSVSLGNIEDAYNHAAGGKTLAEFYPTEELQNRQKEYGEIGGKMHTALHEVIGHASGQINDGVGTPKETLKNYSSTLEEARADLVALYYLLDPKLVELNLLPSLEAGKAEYDGYIMNGMMLQLRRLDEGADIEEDHMRNRQLVAKWAYEKGHAENVIEKKVIDGKTYFLVNDYDKLRVIFGELLREIQRIKSEGDYEAAEKLVEGYGVKVDGAMLKEVKERYAQFDIAPYSGFLQPVLEPVMEGDEIKDVKIRYATSFAEQMMNFSENYSFLKAE
ncbi:dipeptidyl-peptidase 3 family protein [Bernardetia sp.]|uniref:dipeptidyl-peptidase 3 family protein n=1 Tax=Bernardetia sp. TaxID=1937974 RepID=UPI0025BE1003|nr:dihydrofolate reductase [Bernardetia sp.]